MVNRRKNSPIRNTLISFRSSGKRMQVEEKKTNRADGQAYLPYNKKRLYLKLSWVLHTPALI